MWVPFERRVSASLVLVLMTSAAAEAEQVQVAESFDQLRVVVNRDANIWVTLTTGQEIEGRVADLSTSSLTLERMPRALLENEVAAIRQRRADSVKNGAWWGLGAGVGVGLIAAGIGAGADAGYLGESTAIAPVLIAAPLCSLLGAAVDAMIHGKQVIYTRGARSSGRLTSSSVTEIPTSFHQMQVLVNPGDAVRVNDNAGRELRGTIVSLTGSSLALSINGSRHDLLEGDVATIRQRRGDPLTNGLLWGFGVGAGLGVVSLLAGGCEGSVEYLPVCMGTAGAIASGIGVAVDAAIRREHVIYARAGSVGDDRRGQRVVRIVPLMTSGRKGILLAFPITR